MFHFDSNLNFRFPTIISFKYSNLRVWQFQKTSCLITIRFHILVTFIKVSWNHDSSFNLLPVDYLYVPFKKASWIIVFYLDITYNIIFSCSYTRISVTFNNYNLFTLYKTTEVVIGVIFHTVNFIGKNICIAT